ncbi:hypothetical protein D0867_05996 [Hortaea werneckii]|uniref:Uncharacterized protein n=1 Tax=Hortaea werneckii TaxID=91943 RepID=A0A3M6ZQU5_HORWE|nr:hypothetical protein D0867_05996 [Hortaea werneckii]
MAPDAPPRRFAPTPVETSTESSKDRRQQPEEDEKPQTRRFAVEPVSTEQKSSKDRHSHGSTNLPKSSRFAPGPVSVEHKSSKDRQGNTDSDKPAPRRFAPEPVSVEQRSSKDRSKEVEAEKPESRRFVPQLEVTEAKSSRGRSESEDKQSKPRRFAPQLVEESASRGGSKESSPVGRSRFAPQLAETTYRSNRTQGNTNGSSDPPRKFAPVLLDTASRSRRSGKAPTAAAPLNFKTESGFQLHARENRRHIRGDKTPAGEGEGDGGVQMDGLSSGNQLDPAEIMAAHPELRRRELSPMDGTTPRRYSGSASRNHAYQAPHLEPIESSESEQLSHSSSVSSSPGANGSPLTLSDSSFNEIYNHATRRRESVDDTFQQYLLQLEAKKAQQRFEEQALAAFPNSDFHEPVAHYVMDEESSEDMEVDDRPVTWAGYDEDILISMARRRESTVKVTWEQLEMQRHAERLEQERNAAKTTLKQPSQSPWWQPDTYGAVQTERELKSMRDRARPPLLGNDIVFPRSKSPEPARFDVTQGSSTLRNQMCYLTEHASSQRSGEDEGLWHPPAQGNEHVLAARLKAAENPDMPSDKGLWGGFCVDDGENKQGTLGVPAGPTGLMTPRPSSPAEPAANPFEQSFAVPGIAAPQNGIKTPPGGAHPGDARIDNVILDDRELDELMRKEYPDSFVTQVYNYLSLGYPTLAKPFDEELAKISGIPISELRKDDKVAKQTPRGYIRLGPDFEGGGGQGLTEQNCMRWQALKRYIREWARQEKNMVKVDGPFGNWGTGARRGSWAI